MNMTCFAFSCRMTFWFLVGSLLLAVPAHAQTDDEALEDAPAQETQNAYGSSLGAQVVLTNSGFGLGGLLRVGLGERTSFMTEVALGAGKDEREVAFFDRFGRKDVPNKAHYLLMLPVQFGLHRRLFRAHIEDNFRPYVQVSTGPTLGWEYPYFEDCNGDLQYDPNTDCNGDGTLQTEEGERIYDSIGAIPKGHLRTGLGGTVAFGAHFGFSRKATQGVRFGYTFTYFFDGIQLLEPQVREPQHFFGTPSISVFFGRLF